MNDDRATGAPWPPPARPVDATAQPGRRGRRGLALGVGAGLLAGGAIGLWAGLPGAISAANETGDPAPLVVPEQSSDATDTTAGDDVSDHGARLRETLQPLVDDGTLEPEQADAVSEFLAQQRPERGERGGMGGHGGGGEMGGGHHRGGPALDAAAEAIGIDTSTLRDEMSDGSSLADVATAHGVDVQTVIDALVADAQEHLDHEVADGRMDADEAATRAADLEDRITALVNGERPARPDRSADGDPTVPENGTDDGGA